MALPSQLVYNDLDGEEVKHVLAERFQILLNKVSYLQRHMTLPRVKMTLQVHLDLWADQPNPQGHTIQDEVEIRSEGTLATVFREEEAEKVSYELEETVNASPKGGQPPDKVREQHGLGIPTPVRGKVAVEDHVAGKRIEMDSGAIVDRTGKDPNRQRATVVHQDYGPGYVRFQTPRPQVNFGNQDRERFIQGKPVIQPEIPEKDDQNGQ